jgi:hypothetical protein
MYNSTICTRTLAITITECVQRTGDFLTTFNCTLLSIARIRARFIANIEQQSFRSERIYWCDWSIINTEVHRLCLRAHLLAWIFGLVHSEFRFLLYFTDARGYTSTRLLHPPKIASFSSRLLVGDVQVDNGRRTVSLWKTFQLISYLLFVHFDLCTRVGGCGNVYPYTVTDDRVGRDKKTKINLGS